MESLEYRKNKTIKELMLEGRYKKELLEDLMVGKHQSLFQVPIEDRANKEFMEPLLYAVKKEIGSYIVYTYCEGTINDDITLASEIVKEEPKLIEGKPISRNAEFIIENIKNNPEIIKYMSSELKKNPEVIEEICQVGNEQVIESVINDSIIVSAILANPELSNNKEFMSNAIEKEGSAISLASEELKNDYDFLKEAYKSNINAIDYTAEHTAEFGEKGLLAAKEVVIETSSNNAIKGFEQKKESVKKQLEALRTDDTKEHDEEIKKVEMNEKRLQRHIRFIEKIKNGEVDQVRAAQLIEQLCRNLEPEYKKRIQQVLTIDTAMKERVQEGSKKVIGNDIEKVAKDFEKMSGVEPQIEIQVLKEALREPVHEQDKIDRIQQ